MLMVVVLVKTMMWRPSHAWTGIVGDMCGVWMGAFSGAGGGGVLVVAVMVVAVVLVAEEVETKMVWRPSPQHLLYWNRWGHNV